LKKQKKILFLFLLIPIFFGSLYSVAIEYPMILQIRNDTTALINKSAENNYLLWNKTWGGASTDYSQGVALDTAGNIYCTGYTNSFGVGAYDLALVKFYPNGTRVWNTTWGGASDDQGYGVVLDTAGNIYCAGYTTSFGAGGWDFALVKFYPNGTRAWNTTWGGASTDYDQGVALDTAGNIYCTGYTNSFGAGAWDLALVKFYPNGTRAWNTTWGGASTDFGQGVALDTAGNIYCTGRTFSFGAGNSDLPLVKFDSNGTKQWNITWGGASADYGQGVALDTAGNIYCTGYTTSFGAGGSDFALVKFYPNGYIAWNKTWGGSSNDVSWGVALDTAGNIYCTGYTNSFGAGNGDFALVKFYTNGNIAWNKTWGGASSDQSFGVALDTAGNIYYTGHTTSFGAGGSDFALVKFGINPTTTGTTPVIPGFELTPIIVLISILIVFILNKNLKTTKKLEFANKKNCTSGCILPHQLITSSAN